MCHSSLENSNWRNDGVLVFLKKIFFFFKFYLTFYFRLNPKNDHQLPTIVALCGPHIQGAQGITCARLLANHNVKTFVYVPNFVKMDHYVEEELLLYDLTDGQKTSCARGKKLESFSLASNKS